MNKPDPVSEHIRRRCDFIEFQSLRMLKAIGITPGMVTDIESNSTEPPRGTVKKEKAKRRRTRRYEYGLTR